VFVSRRIRKRRCHNADQVEAVFKDAGFEVIFPEDHPLADQVQFFRRAEVVAGFAGSGMFHVAFAGAPKHVILVGSDTYVHTNEYMMSSVVGHRLDVVVGRSVGPGQGREWSANHDDFVVDMDREGAFLREILADL
jgi:capsular polysaccharide biosynthesis protein